MKVIWVFLNHNWWNMSDSRQILSQLNIDPKPEKPIETTLISPDRPKSPDGPTGDAFWDFDNVYPSQRTGWQNMERAERERQYNSELEQTGWGYSF
jgi:hypothetical protein